MTTTIEIVEHPTGGDRRGTGSPAAATLLRGAARAEELAAILASGSTVFLARVDGVIVGSLTLVMYRIPTGLKAWIEDVVVDEAARGHGVGEALNHGCARRGPPRRRHRCQPDQPTVAYRRQPALPTNRLRPPRHQRLPLRPLTDRFEGCGPDSAPGPERRRQCQARLKKSCSSISPWSSTESTIA